MFVVIAATPESETYEEFTQRVYAHREELCRVMQRLKTERKMIIAYGASTKGNVLLQFCKFTAHDIPFIAEVNKDKFGCYTPGTHIPIISERKAKTMHPDCLFILPWHFKENFLKREKDYLKNGGLIVIPFPQVDIIKGGA